MKGKDFLNSKWVKKASNPETQKQVKNSFGKWSNRVKNTGILNRANQLWQYFISKEITATQKITVTAALLYIISPLDLIPDFIPVLGWLDDIGVASFALAYIFRCMDGINTDDILESEISGTSEEELPAISTMFDTDASPFDFSDLQETPSYLSGKLGELADIAGNLNISDHENIITGMEQLLSEHRMHKIFVVGRYSTGKSTLINALIENAILPSSPIPTTKAITYLMNGDKQSLFCEDADGEIIALEELSDLLDENNQVIRNAKTICVTTPEFNFTDLTIVDTPGLEDPEFNMSQLTLDMIPEADLLIVVLDKYLQSEADIEFIKSLLVNDRDKKLFIVLNKVDGMSEQEVDEIVKTCNSTLATYGIHNPRIYPLSALQTINGDSENMHYFNYFKEELVSFLSNDLSSEIKRRFDNEVTAFSQYLLDACDTALNNTITGKESLEKYRNELSNARKEIEKAYRKENKDILSKFKQHQTTLISGFTAFCNDLKIFSEQSINKATLAELKNTNTLSEKLKQEIINYLEPRIIELQGRIKIDLEQSQDILKNQMARLSINVKTSDNTHFSGLFVPITVGLGFLSFGFFSFTFIGLVIASIVGRNFFEDAIGRFLEKHAANKIKGQLIPETLKQIDIIKDDIRQKLEESFVDIEDELTTSIQASKAKTIAVLDVVDNNGSEEELQIVEECRIKLENLINN